MNAWDNEDCGTQPGDTSPNGQKCLYKVHFHNFLNTVMITDIGSLLSIYEARKKQESLLWSGLFQGL